MAPFPGLPLVHGFVCASVGVLARPALSSVLWTPSTIVQVASELPKLQISLLLGAWFGFLSIVALTLLLVPIVIIAWTTALVIQFLFGKGFGHPRRFIQDGHQMAIEICRHTIVNILQEGRVVGLVAGVFCFFTLKKI